MPEANETHEPAKTADNWVQQACEKSNMRRLEAALQHSFGGELGEEIVGLLFGNVCEAIRGWVHTHVVLHSQFILD